MRHLSVASRIMTPAAMVAFLTIEITKSQTFAAPIIYVIAVAAFFTSIGIEAWGIMAGQNLERAWRVNRNKWATAVQLILYVVIASYLLRTNPTLVVLPLVAALVYVSAALSDAMETAVHEQARDTAVSQQAQLDEQRRQADHNRQMELKAQQQAHDERLEKLRLKGQNFQPKAIERQPKAAESQQLSGSALKVYEAFTRNPRASNAEIGESIGLSGQRVGQIKQQLNGQLKGGI